MSHKYLIKLPTNIEVYYDENRQFLTIKSKLGIKTISLNTKLILLNNKKILKITKEPFKNSSTSFIKKLKIIQGLTLSIIKQIILELSQIIFKKLKLVGVGYKIFDVSNQKFQIIYLKLGLSHFVYFKLPSNIKIITFKSTKIFILGNSVNSVNELAVKIRKFRLPEPYKGKGVLYNNEKILLKESKKN